MEAELPIDIHYNKLLGWLIDRRHCNVKWATQLRGIKEKIAKTTDQQNMSYLKCKEIFEMVKKEEGEDKSLFGKYLSPKVQEWWDIVKEFEKGGVHLADSAQLMTRNVNYEIPALKQNIARSQQIQKDCLKKEQDYRNSAANLRVKYQTSCLEMGIKGDRVGEELQHLLSELPIIFDKIITDLPSITPAIAYYHECTTSTCRSVDEFLTMLQYLIENGNVTVYQWRHGIKPQILQDSSVAADKTERDDIIDWGDLSPNNPPTAPTTADSDIDWNIDTDNIIVVEESGEVGVVSSGGGVASEELESLMSCHETRTLLIDDLMELKEFFEWRLQQLTSVNDTSVQFLNDESVLSQQGSESVKKMLAAVEKVLQPLNTSRTKNLLMMKTSPHYLDRMTNSILSHLLLANKAQSQAELMAGRAEEAVDTAMRLQPQLESLISETRSVQRQVEEDISQLYRGREVNIIGEINVTLQQ